MGKQRALFEKLHRSLVHRIVKLFRQRSQHQAHRDHLGKTGWTTHVGVVAAVGLILSAHEVKKGAGRDGAIGRPQ